ncbi:hypothetical protein QLF84_24200, partial [Salmonella enterica subsp. enterica serovar Oslo]|nr:hypothetical protein [Salmonella enterica subsp. enterica serovar Oslo]
PQAQVEAVPAASTVSGASLAGARVVTRDGGLSPSIAAVDGPDTTLLTLLCIVSLPPWLLRAGKPMLPANRHEPSSGAAGAIIPRCGLPAPG